MGGPAGSGGSDESDERKVDTYSDQHKKIEKRKSKYKTDKHGNIKKKNIIDTIADNHPVVQNVKNFADKHNLNKRMKYANKHGVNLQGLSTEEILSKDFKNKLDAATDGGYTKSITAPQGAPDEGWEHGGNNNILTSANTSSGVVTNSGILASSPTTAEIDQSTATTKSADETLLATNKKGRSTNILTTAGGLGESNLKIKRKTLGA